MLGSQTFFEDTMTLFTRELLIFRSNLRTNVIRSIIFPFVIILFFGNIGSSITNIPVAVVNYANNLASSNYIGALSLGSSISVKAITTEEAALSMLQKGAVTLVVVILPSFPSPSTSSPSITVYYKNTQFATASVVLGYIRQIAARFSVDPSVTYQAFTGAGAPSETVQASPITGASGSYKDFLAGGVLAMVVIFGSIFGGGITLITDRQLGNLKSFLIAPISKDSIVAARLLSGAAQSAVYSISAILVSVLLGAHIAMGLPGVLLIILVCVLLGFNFSAVAVILATRIKAIDVYAIAVQAVALPTWFLSGGLTPTQSLPSWLYPLSLINPVTYVVTVLRDIIVSGVIQTGDLTAFAIAMIAFGAVAVPISMRSMKSTIA